jgi:hypothetical protein
MSLKAAIAALLGYVEPEIKKVEKDIDAVALDVGQFTTMVGVSAARTIHDVINDVQILSTDIRSLVAQAATTKTTLAEKQAALVTLQAEYTKMSVDVGNDITALTAPL